MDLNKVVFSYKKYYDVATNEQIINYFNKKWDKIISQIMKKTKEKEKISTYKFLENKRYEEYIELLKKLKIVIPFPQELLNQMDKVFVMGTSLKNHFEHWTTRGKCYSMSVALSQIFFDKFIINRGKLQKPLITFEHQWLEYDGNVYDTTFHLIFPKEIYYNLYYPKNIHTLTNEEIDEIKNNNRIEVKTSKRK